MDPSNIMELVRDLSLSEFNISELNKEKENLSKQLNNQKNNSMFKEENEFLETIHKIAQEDILKYNQQIKELEAYKSINIEKIKKLKNENEELKRKEKLDKNQEFFNRIKNINDLSKTLGFNLINNNNIKNEENENENDVNKEIENNKNIQIKNLEMIQKKKTDFEIIFIELKEKCNEYYKDIEQQKLIKDNYRKYLNDINKKMNIYNERLNISVINFDGNIENNEKNENLEDIYKQIEKISILIVDLDEIFFDVKKIFGENIENLLNEIQQNLINIDNRKYKNENHLNNIIQNIGNKIEEIKNLCFLFEENKNNFNDKNKIIENEINILKEKEELIEKEKEKNKINENKINNIININQDIENDNIQNNQSFLFGIKDQIWKTKILFKNKEEDLIENYLDEPQLLRKNWHEICYIYDEYDIHDIYYDIKAVGLNRNSYFPSGSHGFCYDSKVEIQSFKINEIESEYIKKDYSIKFKLNLYNLQTAKIHILFKESKDLDKLTLGEIEERKIYRYEYYGLDRSLAGQTAKFSLILKGNFDIVNFKEFFLVKNKKNLNEIEYSWGGRVPYEGKRTLIMLSKNQANWSFKMTSKFQTINNNIENINLYVPIEFVGGNNEIIRINASSSQTNNIILDEEKREYIVKYKNINENKGEFVLEGELCNRCKGEWFVDLTDEEIENKIPEEDKLCKIQLQNIAKNIIEEFDRENKNTEIAFLDYMKIALWVKKNIKYDLNYIGRDDLSSIDIYNMKVGVCHHFTKLSNALLYSLGYKVIYIAGYACKQNKEFNNDSGHAWSLIKLNNKWYPFDSTWGIISGKLPVGHIFGYFFNKGAKIRGFDDIQILKSDVVGTYIK